jgi:hypothetical protein
MFKMADICLDNKYNIRLVRIEILRYMKRHHKGVEA